MVRLRDVLDYVIFVPVQILKFVWVQLVVLAVMFITGAAIFAYYQGLDALTALLGSVSTITTIGLYSPNILTMPALEKVLLIVVIIVSVGSAASLVQGTVSAVVKGELPTEILASRRVNRMKGHVIVFGYKFLGKYVVESLKSMGLEFVIIVVNPDQLDSVRKEGLTAIEGPITHVYETLKKAGIEKASSLVVTSDDDGDNMLAILSAKKLNKNVKTVAPVNNRELTDSIKDAGADIVVPIYEMIGQALASSVISKEESTSPTKR